jgi:hypothetical protein
MIHHYAFPIYLYHKTSIHENEIKQQVIMEITKRTPGHKDNSAEEGYPFLKEEFGICNVTEIS